MIWFFPFAVYPISSVFPLSQLFAKMNDFMADLPATTEPWRCVPCRRRLAHPHGRWRRPTAARRTPSSTRRRRETTKTSSHSQGPPISCRGDRHSNFFLVPWERSSRELPYSSLPFHSHLSDNNPWHSPGHWHIIFQVSVTKLRKCLYRDKIYNESGRRLSNTHCDHCLLLLPC